MILHTPVLMNSTKSFPIPTDEQLQARPCGIHRGSLADVMALFPELIYHISNSPFANQEVDDFEFDVKVHMLMKGMYPCIPNWHCDNVPRGDDGKVDYEKASQDRNDRMYLWVSGAPTTEFLSQGLAVPTPKNHGELAQQISVHNPPTFKIPSKTWVSMDRATPHRGNAAEESGWRIFIRATPKSIAPDRPVVSTVRRHAQVYLPHDFHW